MALLHLVATGGIAATCCYLLADDEAGVCVLVDAPDHTAAPLLREAHARRWTLQALWLTHGHFDHVADHPLVPAGVPVLLHRDDWPKLRDPQQQIERFGRMTGFRVPLSVPPREPDDDLNDGDVLRVGSHACQVLHTPGHAPGHVCFYWGDDALLIGGDLIIGGAVGRTDLPDSDAVALDASIRRVMALPDTTRLLPGHGRPTTIGYERATNPYVRTALGLV